MGGLAELGAAGASTTLSQQVGVDGARVLRKVAEALRAEKSREASTAVYDIIRTKGAKG